MEQFCAGGALTGLPSGVAVPGGAGRGQGDGPRVPSSDEVTARWCPPLDSTPEARTHGVEVLVVLGGGLPGA